MPEEQFVIIAQRLHVDAAAEASTVSVDGGRVFRLEEGPKGRSLAGLLRTLEDLGRPAYLVVADDVVVQVRVPVVGRVERFVDGRYVQLDTSHARHVVGADADEGVAAFLDRAVTDRRQVVLTSDDRGVILDVRDWEPGPDDGPRPPLPPWPPPAPEIAPWLRWIPINRLRLLIHKIWLWPLWPWWWFRGISPKLAQKVFDEMAATSCAPLTVPSPCIPFMYPDDGCWARAHEMCRLMIIRGLSPRKVWIDHSTGHWLTVATKNNPSCHVTWGWHVAPTLLVRTPWFFLGQVRVIDPSLFTGPVTQATWKGVQGDPGATLTPTTADQFWHGGGTDPTYSSSNMILAQYRAALQARSLNVGPPPYANC
jgi:Glutaminase